MRDQFNRVSECESSAPVCCEAPMKIAIQPVMGMVQRDCQYLCPVTDRPVTSNRQRRNIMAEHGLIDANDVKPAQTFEKRRRVREANEKLAAELPKPDEVARMKDLYPALPA